MISCSVGVAVLTQAPVLLFGPKKVISKVLNVTSLVLCCLAACTLSLLAIVNHNDVIVHCIFAASFFFLEVSLQALSSLDSACHVWLIFLKWLYVLVYTAATAFTDAFDHSRNTVLFAVRLIIFCCLTVLQYISKCLLE